MPTEPTVPPNEAVPPTETSDPKFRRTALKSEVDYRRDRRASIFTWANSVLVAVTGGVIALQVQGAQPTTDTQRLVLSGSVLVVGLFSAAWWQDQRRIGDAYKERLAELDHELGIVVERPDGIWSKVIGGLTAILLLMAVALIAIWLR